MPEAGEGFDFTSYLERVARLSGRKKLGKTIEMIVLCLNHRFTFARRHEEIYTSHFSVCVQENPLKDSRKAR